MEIVAQHRPRMTYPVALAMPQSAFAAPVFLYFLAVMLPSELAINFFGAALIPVRILLLALLVPALMRLVNDADFRLQAFDVLVLLSLAWLLFALIHNNGLDKGAKFGGGLVLEALGGYLLARAYVRTCAQFADAVRAYLLFIAIAAAIAIPETFFGARFVHEIASAISGVPLTGLAKEAPRFGLARAESSFDHPILYGAFCASALGLAWYLLYGRPVRWLVALAIGGATLCSVSSAPLLGCALIGAIVAWEYFTRGMRNRVAVLLAVLAVGYVVIEVASNRGMHEILINLVALDSRTAYYRVLIWQFATQDLANNPLTGVGLDAWTREKWMTTSIDSFWLYMALMGGLPVIAFLGLGVAVMMRRVHRRVGVEARQRWQARMGWTATMLAVFLQAFTVHYWSSMNSWFFFLLGLGAWLTDSRDGLRPRRASGAQPATKTLPAVAMRRRRALILEG